MEPSADAVPRFGEHVKSCPERHIFGLVLRTRDGTSTREVPPMYTKHRPWSRDFEGISKDEDLLQIYSYLPLGWSSQCNGERRLIIVGNMNRRPDLSLCLARPSTRRRISVVRWTGGTRSYIQRQYAPTCKARPPAGTPICVPASSSMRSARARRPGRRSPQRLATLHPRAHSLSCMLSWQLLCFSLWSGCKISSILQYFSALPIGPWRATTYVVHPELLGLPVITIASHSPVQ